MTRTRRLAVALVLNVLLVVALAIAGALSGSLGLLADAGHDLADVGALTLTIVAVRLAQRPATGRRSFGWHRATVLAAQANAAVLLVISAAVAVEAIRRLVHPSSVDGPVVVVMASVALVVNVLASRIVGTHDHDLAMRSAMLHLLGDAAAAGAVLIAGIVITISPNARGFDAAASLVVAATVAYQAAVLLREAVDVLLEAAPTGLDDDVIVAALTGVEGVESVHDVHVWSLSSDVRVLAAHVVMEGHPTLEDSQVVVGRMHTLLTERFAIAHATIEQECEPCGPVGADTCSIAESPVRSL